MHFCKLACLTHKAHYYYNKEREAHKYILGKQISRCATSAIRFSLTCPRSPPSQIRLFLSHIPLATVLSECHIINVFSHRCMARARRTHSAGEAQPDCWTQWCWTWYSRSLGLARWRPWPYSSTSLASIRSAMSQLKSWRLLLGRPLLSTSGLFSMIYFHDILTHGTV